MLFLATATHSFKWVKITHLMLKHTIRFLNLCNLNVLKGQ